MNHFYNVSPAFSMQAVALSTLRRNAFDAYFTFCVSSIIYCNVGSFSNDNSDSSKNVAI